MKFGFRTPSLKKSISARLSPKRAIKNALGLRMPRGTGWITNPKKALYNKVYNKTTFGVKDIMKSSSRKSVPTKSSTAGTSNPLAIWLLIAGALLLCGQPWFSVLIVIGLVIYNMMPSQKALSYAKIAVQSFDNGNKEGAVLNAKNAFELQPKNPEYKRLYAFALNNVGKYQEAQDLLEEYVTANPTREDVLFVLGYCYYKNEKLEHARKCLQQISPESSDYVRSIVVIADTYTKENKLDLALAVLKEGPLRKRISDDSLVMLHYQLACLYELRGEKKKAINEFAKVMAVDPEHADTEQRINALMGTESPNIQLSEPKIIEPTDEGNVPTINLKEWFSSAFTLEEQQYMNTVFQPLGSNSTLTQDINSLSENEALSFLTALVGWFDNPRDRKFAFVIIKKAEEYVSQADILDQHFFWSTKMKLFYKERESNPENLEIAIKSAQKQISLAPRASIAFKKEMPGPLPFHEGYVQLCIILDKQGKYEEAIALAQKAKSEGWNEDWDKRIERLKSKIAKKSA